MIYDKKFITSGEINTTFYNENHCAGLFEKNFKASKIP